MYGRYSEALGDYAREEAERQRLTEKGLGANSNPRTFLSFSFYLRRSNGIVWITVLIGYYDYLGRSHKV